MPVLDIHAHFEPRMLELGQVIERLDDAGIARAALIATINEPLPAETPDRLLAVLRRVLDSPVRDLVRALDRLFYTPGGDLKLAGKVYEIYRRPDNAPIAAAIAAHPDRLVGWIFLNPALSDDPIAELERWRAAGGFIGVKLHPFWHRYAVADALPLARRCEELGLPMLIHLGWGPHGAWQTIADACPRLDLVFAHLGMPYFSALWRAVADRPRIRLDVSSPYLDERIVRRAVAALGPRRILYGTDAPYGFCGADRRYDYRHIKGWVERLPCPAADIERILGDNAAELIG